jgi:hypothetical protein
MGSQKVFAYMKAPDRNCMYCHQRMSYAKVWESPDCGTNCYTGKGHYIYMCECCKSQQDIDIPTGKPIYHTFKVGKYQLSFLPQSKHWPFRIADCSDEDNGPDTILTLDTLSTYLTPQNTTEERVGLLLLFS